MAPLYATQVTITLSVLASSATFCVLRKYFRTVVKYEAPFERTKDPEQEVPGQYVVRLKPGYGLEQHSASTGYDIEKYVSGLIGQAVHPDRVVYLARDVGPEMLAAIRADRGVISVSPEYFVNLGPNKRGWVSTSGEGSPFEHDVREYDPSSPRFPMEYDPTSPPLPP
jgi:hypothetical protein